MEISSKPQSKDPLEYFSKIYRQKLFQENMEKLAQIDPKFAELNEQFKLMQKPIQYDKHGNPLYPKNQKKYWKTKRKTRK